MADIFKSVGPKVWVFDIETVPCLSTIRRVYEIPNDVSDEQALDTAYLAHGANAENPRPFLKSIFHRVVSISAMIRRGGVEPTLQFFTLPSKGETEAEMIGRFLAGIGRDKPQLVGFASVTFDMNVLVQRAILNDCVVPEFCRRPDKPWEGYDYFSNASEGHVDLLKVLSSSNPSSKAPLDFFAKAYKVPGKVGVSGADVAELWKINPQTVIDYNETDTATTYLLWLKILRFMGRVTVEEYNAELSMFRSLLETKGGKHWENFINEWDSLNA